MSSPQQETANDLKAMEKQLLDFGPNHELTPILAKAYLELAGTHIKSPEEVDSWDAELSQYVFNNTDDGFYHKVSKARLSTPAFNRMFKGKIPSQLLDRKSPADYFIQEVGGVSVDSSAFDPRKPDVFQEYNRNVLNAYRTDVLTAASPNWESHPFPKLVEAHIKKMCGDDHYGHLVISHMAHTVQNPGVRLLYTPLIISKCQGIGKSTLINVMASVLSHMYVRDVPSKSIGTQFNGWADGQLYCVFDELGCADKRGDVIYESTQAILTNEYISLEKKGKEVTKFLNTSNFMAFSNKDRPLIIKGNDRRWFVIRNEWEDLKALHEDMQTVEGYNYNSAAEFFEEYMRLIRDEPGVLAGWLQNYKVEPDLTQLLAPKTEAKKDLLHLSLSGAAQEVKELMDQGGHYGISDNVVSIKHLNDILDEVKGCKPLPPRMTASVMAELNLEKHEHRYTHGGHKLTMYVDKALLEDNIKSLAKCVLPVV